MVKSHVFSGYIVEEDVELSLAELSRACCVNAEWLMALVEEGILEPVERDAQWHFSGCSLQRVHKVRRLQRDLGINLSGAALALELLGEIDILRARLTALESGGAER